MANIVKVKLRLNRSLVYKGEKAKKRAIRFNGFMKNPINNKETVIVGMSGGVDSSTTAAILKNQGYKVAGVFMQLWKENDKREKNNIQDVKSVCKKLAIPLKIVDVRERFKKEVVGYFLREYKKGRTPNLCVFCNKNFKLKLLLEEMLKMKADYIATGHYARIVERETCSMKRKGHKLLKAKDEMKDQSYFLYTLGQKELKRIMFPLGECKKTEVREMARKFGLPVSEKSESQDICFLAGTEVAEFLKNNLGKLRAGNIIDSTGNILGRHKGLALYTIGQRKGIEIGGTGPYYVAAKDKKKNELVVTSCQSDDLLYTKETILEKVNWVSEKPKLPFRTLVKVRYQTPSVYGIIKVRETRNVERGTQYNIIFDEAQRAVTAGQSAVFYSEEGEVLGGGIIR